MFTMYTITTTEFGRIVEGTGIPLNDFGHLAKMFEDEGLSHIATNVSNLVAGAVLAVTATPKDEKLWLDEIRKNKGIGVDDWLYGVDVGDSSGTIYGVFTGNWGGIGGDRRRASVPYDPADFGRCYRLLDQYPEWAGQLDKVSEAFPFWAPIVEAWPAMTALWEQESPSGSCPKLYKMMQPLTEASGAIKRK